MLACRLSGNGTVDVGSVRTYTYNNGNRLSIMQIPRFEDQQLEQISDSLRRRRRALRNKTRSINLDRVIESEGGCRTEKLELTVEPLVPRRAYVRVFLWADRFIWVDARQPSKNGWRFSWSKEGQLVGRKRGQLQKTIEQTIDELAGDPTRVDATLEELWAPIISTGLRSIGARKKR